MAPSVRRTAAAAARGPAPQVAASGGIALPTAGPILETDFVNTPFTNRQGNWTKKVAGGDTFMTLQGPSMGWLNVHNTGEQFCVPLTGMSGTIVSKPEVSGSDLPFLHPFGFDFEFLVLPDKPFFDLVGPNMTDSTYKAGTAAAKAIDPSAPGVVGMEIENKLVPGDYRPKDVGERVCLWGRWIVDAGHDDFHTEIHPPLMMVTARPVKSRQQEASRQRVAPGAEDATEVRIITRPYLVSQKYDDGFGLFGHLATEAGKALALVSTKIEAHPKLMPKPFTGLNIMMFKLRPPTGFHRPGDRIFVELRLTRRSESVAIQVVPGTDGQSVRVVVVLNDASYKPALEPNRTNKMFKVGDIRKLDQDAADIMQNVIFATALLNPIAAVVINNGVETHEYPPLRAPTLPAVTRTALNNLRQVPMPPDTTQPFPIAGTIRVEWERFAATSGGVGPVKKVVMAKAAAAKKAPPARAGAAKKAG